MSANRDVIVQEIRQSFEGLLGSVWEQGGETRTAYEVEKQLFASLLAIGRSLLLLYFVSQSQKYRSHQVSGNQSSGSNGETIPYHSERLRAYQSVFGKFKFSRSYYYGSGQSQYPADAALNLPKTQCSDLLREWMEKLGVADPYGKSAKFLSGLLGQSLWGRDLKVELKEDAGLIEEFYQQAPSPVIDEEAIILVVQADGKGVPVLRGETAISKARLSKGEKPGRKKEAIVTAVYTLRPHVRTPENVVASLFKQHGSQQHGSQQEEMLDRNESSNKTSNKTSQRGPQEKRYWATLEGKQAAMEFTQQQVSKRDGLHVKHKLALTDGSEALQERVRENLPGHRLILDFIHADEYLWKAGNALFGEKGPQREQWVKQWTLELLCGRTNEVIAQLRGKADKQRSNGISRRVLEQVANYYERNIAYMRYDEYLSAGWPIATGVIEGACRHLVKDRCELSGMRWSQMGAESLLRMRCVDENGDWENYHDYRRLHRQRTLYAGVTPLSVDSPGSSLPMSPHIRLAA